MPHAPVDIMSPLTVQSPYRRRKPDPPGRQDPYVLRYTHPVCWRTPGMGGEDPWILGTLQGGPGTPFPVCNTRALCPQDGIQVSHKAMLSERVGYCAILSNITPNSRQETGFTEMGFKQIFVLGIEEWLLHYVSIHIRNRTQSSNRRGSPIALTRFLSNYGIKLWSDEY